MTTYIPQITLFSNKEEEWQRRQILDNLPNLIQLTSCNVVFLSIIQKAGALADYEEQELVHKYPVPVEKSRHFYKILVTRKNCYHILRDALEQTRQTGALETLDDAMLTDVLNGLGVPLTRIREFKNNIDLKLDMDGSTLVHKAVETCGVEQLQKLKLLKADFEAKDVDECTPFLRIAYAKTNFAKILAWFVSEQFDLHVVDKVGNNLVFLAALNGKSKDELQLLVNTGVKWDIKNKKCRNIMHLAAEGGNAEALKYFKSLGADVNARDELGRTPLLRLTTAKKNFADTFGWFVSEKIDLHTVDTFGNNLVFLATVNGKSKDDLQLLVNTGVKWDITNNNCLNIMHLAAESGNAEVLKYFKLLEAKKVLK